MPRILVIEDEAMLRDSLLDLLSLEDFEVRGAENGRIGLELAHQEHPDLIICDVMMPELDGYQVLTALQQDPATATIPFIFLTAKSEPTDLRQGMALGADDYLTKPFSYKELLRAIETRLIKRTVIDQQTEIKLENLRRNLARSLPHEVITPLSIILMSSEILLEKNEPLDQEFARQTLEGIYSAGQRLSGIVQKFLRFAELEMTATNPAQVEAMRRNSTSQIKLLIGSIAKQKAKTFGREKDLVLHLQPSTARISSENLEELLEELLENAFRNSRPGTTVEICSVTDTTSFVLCIENKGWDLASETSLNYDSNVAEKTKKSEKQALGLGLMLAKQLVDIYGGELSIKAKSDESTIIRLSLPM